MLENIHELQQASEIILKQFQAKLYQTDVDAGWNNF